MGLGAQERCGCGRMAGRARSGRGWMVFGDGRPVVKLQRASRRTVMGKALSKRPRGREER